MQKWQKATRVVIALVAVVFAVAVAFSLKKRVAPQVQAPLVRTDEKAILETTGGTGSRTNKTRSELQIDWEKMLTYADGSSKLLGLRVTTERNGKVFEISGKEGTVGHDESTVEVRGAVHVKVSDGLEVESEEATFTKTDGIARAPGNVKFWRGRMTGSGVGFVYDNNQDILTIRDHALVHVAPDAKGAGEMNVAAGTLEFRRRDKVLHFAGGVAARRGAETIAADEGLAHLTEDEEHLSALELRGHSTIGVAGASAGGLRQLSGRDVDLRYGADGRSIEHALITGDGAIQLAGEASQPGREISAGVIELALAADGTTPTSLTARTSASITLPGEQGGVSRKIDAQMIDCAGDAQHGLTSARFSGAVQYRETGPDLLRTARADQLDVEIKPGFSELDDARFSRRVRFVDGETAAAAAAARYLPSEGSLALSGSDRENPVPHVTTSQIQVDAGALDLTLRGPLVHATGSAKSVIQPRRPDAKDDHADTRLPSMLKQDQPVNVTADQLDYDGGRSLATYSGGAQLWQGETVIKAPTLTIDSRGGNLEADGPVTTVTTLQERGKTGSAEKVKSMGTAKTFKYDDDARRATYTGDAHLDGPEGDITAQRIELYLHESGDELERVEAFTRITLNSESSKTTGSRLTYFDGDGRYVVQGAPVRTIDSCGRETTGQTLTFFKATDRIIVDGNEQIRTQTKGKSNCPGT